MSDPNADRDKSIEQHINDLYNLPASARSDFTNTTSLITALRNFAWILWKLSRSATEQAERVVSLTRVLIWFTVALIGIGIVQILLFLFK